MINTEIWGEPSTWINAPIMGGITGATSETLKISNPKCPDFGTSTNKTRLNSGIAEGRIIANEPLDLTICPCGQDEKISAYGKLAIFNEDGALSLTPRIVERTSTVNWFMYDQILDTDRQAENFKVYKNWTQSVSSGMRYDQWSPKSTNDYHNPNMYISPYTFWYMRSILMSIQVGCFNSVSGSSVNFTWRTLDDWKNSYSNQSICAIRCFTRPVNTYNANTNVIEYINSGLSQYNFGGKIGLLDPIPDIDNNGTITDTTFYSFLKYGTSGRTTYLFTPTSSIVANSSIAILPCWEKFDNQTINKTGSSSAGYTYYYLIPYSDDTYEKIMQMIACFGCYFTPTGKYEFNYSMTDTDLCLPIIGEDGIAHGEYTRGSDNLNNDLYDLNSIRDKNYDPTIPHDPNTYSNTTGFNSLSGGASATQRYVLNDSNVRQLLTDLWTITHNIADVDYDKFDYKILDSFLVTDPISSIVSLKRFPFDIPHTFSPSKTNVCLGKNEGTAQGYLTFDVFNSVVFSGVSIYPKFGRSFLDFAPYTEYELYIPFCSTVKLNASEILDHVLSVRMDIDLISGVCVAYIMADDLCIETVTGAVSADMQIAGTDAATADAAIQNAVINHISARTNKEVSMLSPMTPGGLMSVVMNPVKQAGSIESAENSLAKANYDITHINTPVHSMGSAGGLSSWIQEFNCRLIIYYPEGEAIDSSGGVSSTSPKLADLTAYAHNTGFACVMNGTVSQYHGLTVGNIDTSSIQGASEEERNMIKTLFSQGVWLP